MQKKELITTGILLLGVLYFFSIYILKNSSENLTNIVVASTSIVGLLISILTIIVVYNTYIKQAHEINNNKVNVEYNRLLDITYKQLDISISRLHLTDNESKIINETISFTPSIVVDFPRKANIMHNFFFRLDTELSIHLNNILHSDLSTAKRLHLLRIVESNIYSNIREFVDIFSTYTRQNADFDNRKLLMYLDMCEAFENTIIEHNSEGIFD